jgi:hypothetical protein
MALFSRRSLQNMIDALANKLPVSARTKLVHELNRHSLSALGFEWELLLLFALSKAGQVQYEATAAGASQPDITFIQDGNNPIRFTADVATVSDEGLDKQNPIMRFSQSLYRMRLKLGLPGTISYKVHGEQIGVYGDAKMTLQLPPSSKLDAFFNTRIKPELQQLQRDNVSKKTIEIDEDGVKLTLFYDALGRTSTGSYPSYTAAYSAKRNPVYTALRSKVRQLKRSGSPDPFGIFLCDGGSELLANTQRYGTAFHLDHVVTEFFRRTTSISFVAVLLFPIRTSYSPFGPPNPHRFTGSVYVNPRAVRPVDQASLLALINNGLRHVPPPVTSPAGAQHWIEHGEANAGQKFSEMIHGGDIMSQQVKVSARTVLELLAGKLTVVDFMRGFERPSGGHKFTNPFSAALKAGLTIEDVKVTRVANADDDWLEISFGPPDPAISKLKVK